MIVSAAAENTLGTIGTILWTVQLIPQVYKSWRAKSTEGLSAALMLIWSVSAAFLGVYAIVEKLNIPLILQPQLFGALAAVSWIQCLYYGKKYSLRSCCIIFVAYLGAFAGFETGMTYLVRIARRNGHPEVIKVFGISSAVLISVGLIPQYIEIWKRKEVIGISLTFMAVDILGGVFSVLSLAFRNKFDAIAAVTYLAVIVLDSVIVIAAFILNPRAKRRRTQEQLSSQDQRPQSPTQQGTPVEEYMQRFSESEAATTLEGQDLESGRSKGHGDAEKGEQRMGATNEKANDAHVGKPT